MQASYLSASSNGPVQFSQLKNEGNLCYYLKKSQGLCGDKYFIICRSKHQFQRVVTTFHKAVHHKK